MDAERHTDWGKFCPQICADGYRLVYSAAAMRAEWLRTFRWDCWGGVGAGKPFSAMPDSATRALRVPVSIFRDKLDPVTAAIRAKSDNLVVEHPSRHLAQKFSTGHSEHFTACFTFIHPFRHIESHLPVLAAFPKHCGNSAAPFFCSRNDVIDFWTGGCQQLGRCRVSQDAVRVDLFQVDGRY